MLSTILLTLAMASHPLPIVNDDFPTARAEAVRRGVPIFVEVWASW